jgi:hypothetical protein
MMVRGGGSGGIATFGAMLNGFTGEARSRRSAKLSLSSMWAVTDGFGRIANAAARILADIGWSEIALDQSNAGAAPA